MVRETETNSMNITQHKFYTEFLKIEEINASSVPKSILNSVFFRQLINSQIIIDLKSGKGRKFLINKKDSYSKWLSSQTNEFESEIITKSDSIEKLRNSKAVKTNQIPFYFLRGFKNVLINNHSIDLGFSTENFGAFLSNSLNLNFEKICIVENKESFLKSEKIFGSDYIFIHKYGRWSHKDFLKLECKKLIVFSDYDLVGLNEYLEIKNQIDFAEFYLPNNFNELFEKYAYNSNKQINQTTTEKVKNSDDKIVNKVKDLVLKTNRFLEQEALFLGL